jgi:magnesium transporter
MKRYKKEASAKAGLLPGTAVYVGTMPPKPTRISVHIYEKQNYQMLSYFNAEEIKSALLAGQHVWIDVSGLADSCLITDICKEYGIHPLVIEDLLNTRQRPKLDLVGDFLFIVFKLLEQEDDQFNYSTEQFSLLLKERLLLTFRESESYDFSSIYHRLSAEQSLVREHSVDYLSYLILDYIVDGYFNFVEATGQLLEQVEDQLIRQPDSMHLQSFYSLKRRILTLRNIIAPLCDIAHLLLADPGPMIKSHYNLYFRDLHDHCVRLVESIDLHREMSLNMLDIYLSSLNNRLNETMKILTLFASVFIPLTFLSSVYGMNFKFMPELGWRYGYPIFWAVMCILAAVMLYYFKRKKLF